MTCFLQNGYDIVMVARDFFAFLLYKTYVQQVRFDLRRYCDIPRLVSEILVWDHQGWGDERHQKFCIV
jgi:hypothetical protein